MLQPKRILCTGASGFIGSHLIDYLLTVPGSIVLNMDTAKPKLVSHQQVWRQVDILDPKGVMDVVSEFQPTTLIHLAAKADMEGKSLEDYRENVEGTRNILEVVKATHSLQRLVVTSTQHVRKPGSGIARDDEDFDPYEAYGQSKVVTEQLTRKAELTCSWTIVRPTAVWGPGNLDLANGLWRMLAKGLYVHPRSDTVIRSYGYVKNVIFQLMAILNAPRELIDKKVFYLGDPCISQALWVNAFAQALTGRPARTAPKSVLFAIALSGEAAQRLALPAPLYLSRYKNMITTNPVPMGKTMEVLGHGPYSLDLGIQETVHWLRDARII